MSCVQVPCQVPEIFASSEYDGGHDGLQIEQGMGRDRSGRHCPQYKRDKKLTGSKVEMMGVVKADAYGHGVLEVVRTLLDNGVTQLAVSMLDEAIQIRKMGIDVPILVLNYTDPARADEIIHNRVTQTVFSTDLAQALSAAAVRLGKDVRIHVSGHRHDQSWFHTRIQCGQEYNGDQQAAGYHSGRNIHTFCLGG